MAGFFERLEQTPARNAMIEILAELYGEVDADESGQVTYLLQGRLAPTFVDLEFGLGDRLLLAAIAQAFGLERDAVEANFRASGDLGETAAGLTSGVGVGLTVGDVFARLREVAVAEGEGSQERKVSGMARLLADLDPLSNRFIPRIPLERLRLGVGDPTVMDGLSFAKVGDKSQRAQIERMYNLTSDLGLVARTYAAGGAAAISEARVRVGSPVRMAQAERMSSGAEIIAKIGRAAVEPKLDGFRVQIHKTEERVSVFSRNLEDMTGMFPDIAAATRARVRPPRAIFEGEAMGVDPDSGEFRPFQETMSRRRKHDIDQAAQAIPLEVHAFDLLYDGQDVTELPFTERRERLEKIIEPGGGLQLSELLLTEDPDEIETFFAQKVEAGLEGVMAKRLDSPYQAGKRNFNWIKFKRSYSSALNDTLDCVLIGYWRGQGKRAAWGIGALLSAVWDADEQVFKSIARIGTGYSDEEWTRIRELLDESAVPECPAEVVSGVVPDVWTEPRIVVEVLADELTRSPMHAAGRTDNEPGLALRFPRVIGFIREDKQPSDATTVAEARDMFANQGAKPDTK